MNTISTKGNISSKSLNEKQNKQFTDIPMDNIAYDKYNNIENDNENKNQDENKNENKNENKYENKQINYNYSTKELSSGTKNEEIENGRKKEDDEKEGKESDNFNHTDSRIRSPSSSSPRIRSPSSSSPKNENDRKNFGLSGKNYNFSFFNKDKKNENHDNKIQINENKNGNKNGNKNKNKSKDKDDCSTRSISDNGSSDDGDNHLIGIHKGKLSFDSHDLTTVFLNDYFYPFDGKGVLSYLGTEGKSKTYKNPHKSGQLKLFIILFLFFYEHSC